MSADRAIYARKALDQLPRLLGNQDRNPFSPTYGCFHRDYWLDKTSDFPDAVRQFAVHALALVYKHDFPGNIYRGQPKIRAWTIAGMDFWARIQHREGSFDEFYPYERGWVGPSAFTAYATIEAYRLLENELPEDVAARVRKAIRRAAYFIAKGESEEDHLANHHAMACLAVWKAYELLGDAKLKDSFDRLWRGFLSYHNAAEGWSREYDGVDPGYLSATVSFLGKVYQAHPTPEMLDVLRQSAEFCSYFVYPNGFYAGSLGSRNTLHFYPHGFEVLAREVPLAGAVAERMLAALGENKLVPPGIISDRYVVYRVPEYLLAYLDYADRPADLPPLPYQREPFTRYFPESRIFVANRPRYYVVANLAKGGVIKAFDREDGRLLFNDCGLVGRLSDGQIVSSQWIDPAGQVRADDDGWQVAGFLQVVPSNKLFTPLKQIVFRSALVGLGWNPRLAHWLKGRIRKTLILGQRRIPVQYTRSLRLEDDRIILTDEIQINGDLKFADLQVGDEFFVRYVPQSRYFQAQELDVAGLRLDAAMLDRLNEQGSLRLVREVAGTPEGTPAEPDITEGGRQALPMGVYDVDYFVGRQHKRQLVYRLQRRTDEVDRALRRYGEGQVRTVIDVGTADGLMLQKLRPRWPETLFLGLDYSLPLLQAVELEGAHKAQADAQQLPLKSGTADAVIATAIIEHVPDPHVMLHECARILRPGGLLILTTPDPFMDRVASALGLLKDSGHQYTFNLKQLCELAEETGYEVAETRKFMFSPVGFPAEKTIERIFGPLGLRLVMANQLVVARRR